MGGCLLLMLGALLVCVSPSTPVTWTDIGLLCIALGLFWPGEHRHD